MKKQKGFTLVELLVAISIIGVITLIAVPTIKGIIEERNRKTYQKYGDTLVSSAKLYADSYDADLFGMHPSGCMQIDMGTLENKNLVKELQIKNANCNTSGTYIIVKKVNGKYQYQQQLKCVHKKNGDKVLYEHKITSPICTEESSHSGPDINVQNPKSEWVTTAKAYVTIEIEDIDGLLQNNEIKYMWSKDEAGTQIVYEKKLNFGNDLNDKTVTKKISRPEQDGRYYLIVQPINVVDVFGNYTTKKQVKGQYKFDSHKPTCETAYSLESSSVAHETWTNQDIEFKFKFSTNELEIDKYEWITYKDGEKNEQSENSTSVTSKKLKSTGIRTYTLKIFDAAGNSVTCKANKDYWIDKEIPTCEIKPDEQDKWNTESVELTLKTEDKISGVAGKKITTSTTPSYDGTTNKATQSADSNGQKWYGYVKDKAGNTSSCETKVKLDTTKPTLEITNSSGGNWTNQPVTITATATDSGSDIDVIEYSHNGSDWYTDKWEASSTKNKKTGTWTGERNNTFYVRAIDKAGNVTQKSTSIKIDKTAPTLKITNSSGGNWTNQDVKITADYTDEASGMNKLEYSYDQSSWTNWEMNSTTKTEGTWSAERNSTLYVRVTDKAGNTTTKNTSVKIDKTAPTLTIKAYDRKSDESNGTYITEATANNTNKTVTLKPDKWFNSSVAGVNLTISASDSSSKGLSGTMDYDDTGATSFSDSRSLPNKTTRNISDGADTSNFTGNGYRHATYQIQDAAGNKATVKIRLKIDRAAPSLTITNPSGGNWTKGPINMVFDYDDAISGVSKLEYGYNNSTWNNLAMDSKTKTEEPWSAERNDTLYVRVTDGAGNTTVKNTKVKIDKTGPTLTVTNSSNGNWTNQAVNITATASDSRTDIVAIEYSHNDSDWLTGNWDSTSTATKKTGTWTGERNNTFYVRAKDAAGNITKVTSAIKIDKTSPTLTIKAYNRKSDETNGSHISTATANESDNNVTLAPSSWFNSSVAGVNLTISASDSASKGLSGTMYYDNTGRTSFSDSPSLPNGGSRDIADGSDTSYFTGSGYRQATYQIQDAAGNKSTVKIKLKIDRAAPTCSVGTSGTTGNNSWYTGNVTVKLTADSDLSGIAGKGLTTSTTASYSGTVTGTQSDNTSSSGQKWYGYVKDNAGNTGKCEATVKKDSQKPTCEITTSGTEGKNGWYTSNVTVKLTGTDNSKSGVAGKLLTTSTTAAYNGSDFSKSQTSDTEGTKWYGYIKDNAGNTGSCSKTVYKDTEAPYVVEKSAYDAGKCTSFKYVGDGNTIIHRIKMIFQDDTSGITDLFYKYEYSDSTPDTDFSEDTLGLSRSNTIVISRNSHGRYKRLRQDYNLTAKADAWFKFKIVDRAGNSKVTGSYKADYDGSASSSNSGKYCRKVFPTGDFHATTRANYLKKCGDNSENEIKCYLVRDD